jgi:serine protease Do
MSKYKLFNSKVLGLAGLLFSNVLLLTEPHAETDRLPATIVKLKPSIVAVGTFMTKRNPRALFLGTGFAVGDGSLVVTNAHVVPDNLDVGHNEELAVFYRQGDDEKATLVKLVAVDNVHDLALLKLATGKLQAAQLGKTAAVQEGQTYAFTGFPIGMVLGLYPVTHKGMVSAISPNIIPMLTINANNGKAIRQLQQPYDIFQLDATAYPGNSGSPLYDMETGAVIGIINKTFVQESKENVLAKPSGISYAIPANYIEKLLNEKRP